MDFKKNKEKKTIDDTVGFADRLKYMAGPLVLAVGAYFGPDLKKHYDSLPEEEKKKYRKIGYAAAGLTGLTMTIFGGAKYYKETRDAKNKGKEDNEGFIYTDETQ